MIKKLLYPLFFFLFLCTVLYGDDLDILEFLEGKTFNVNIAVRLMKEDRISIWNMDSSKLTISGMAVNLKLYGNDMMILADITPYLNDDNTILLVAQGEVWISSDESDGLTYYTTMKSLPVESGEKIIFFPLGLAVDSNSNVYTMELEIQVIPYSEMVKDENNEEKNIY